MGTIIDIIKQNRLFESVPEDIIEKCIVQRGKTVSLEQNETLFSSLERVNMVLMLLSGKIKLVYYMANGGQDIKNMLFPGNLVGVDLICTRTQLSPYQAIASERSKLFSFPSDIILQPGIMPEKERLTCIKNLLLIISHVNMQNEYRLAILVRNSLRERIMVYLTMQANRNQSETFKIPFTRDEMASFLRVNRSALSHELALLREEGKIDFSKNEFSILKQDDADFEIDAF